MDISSSKAELSRTGSEKDPIFSVNPLKIFGYILRTIGRIIVDDNNLIVETTAVRSRITSF
jgi:hypothetical protein